jgi:hypothetical protein
LKLLTLVTLLFSSVTFSEEVKFFDLMTGDVKGLFYSFGSHKDCGDNQFFEVYIDSYTKNISEVTAQLAYVKADKVVQVKASKDDIGVKLSFCLINKLKEDAQLIFKIKNRPKFVISNIYIAGID